MKRVGRGYIHAVWLPRWIRDFLESARGSRDYLNRRKFDDAFNLSDEWVVGARAAPLHRRPRVEPAPLALDPDAPHDGGPRD